MSTQLPYQFFAGNPLRSKNHNPDTQLSPSSASSAFESLKTHLLHEQEPSTAPPNFKLLLFRRGRPLVCSSGVEEPRWHLGWLSLVDCKSKLAGSGVRLTEDSVVYLGSRPDEDVVYWAADVSEEDGKLVDELGGDNFAFVDLLALTMATDWTLDLALAELAIAGQGRALLEWHKTARFCGHCGAKTLSTDAGRRKQCSNESCKKKIYPRVDPAVIMLVIDREKDRALLSRPSKFVSRLWTSLAGFIEPGESLEEAVRRETYEETGVEVGEVVYYGSQPWPTGLKNMPCQLMVGFFAFAKSFEINVEKEELEDARWHSREDVKKALASAEYKRTQTMAAKKVDEMCKGVEKRTSLPFDFNLDKGELGPMLVPGPFAIAHHLISTWANQGPLLGAEARLKRPSSSPSSL